MNKVSKKLVEFKGGFNKSNVRKIVEIKFFEMINYSYQFLLGKK